MLNTTLRIIVDISSSLSAYKYLNSDMNSFSFPAFSKCNTWPTSCGGNYAITMQFKTFALGVLTVSSYTLFVYFSYTDHVSCLRNVHIIFPELANSDEVLKTSTHTVLSFNRNGFSRFPLTNKSRFLSKNSTVCSY